ncbi:hypothetical protein A1O1_06716 [Capronia coronata CBS 617.96]|uniref:Uncharacterized protein n=1 Tax=Capronia coronata CBS 617.96 TaxID=1182541 RepID=W9XS88_9EURO|nr:uncharacterized protein A1O1_06716 [Capronia coronata CBS 617.96]EXJ83098.1 hypothetical protein A1O1_06716 [Capronia coronata CBS 617.96]
MSVLRSLLLVTATLCPITYAFVDLGYSTLPYEPLHVPTPRPHQLPSGTDLRYELLPSMITAVAPSITISSNGTRETLYSLHYHHYFSKTRQGKGLFKRGVFASDPPIATCTPCDGSGSSITASSTTASTTASCTTHQYHGVFQFPDPALTTSYCYNSNYTGVFEPSTTSSSGLPCCFTIPASCRLNSTTSSSVTYSSGVFRSTTTTSFFSNMSTTTRSSATPSSTASLTTATSTSLTSRSSSSSSSTSTTSSSLSGSVSPNLYSRSLSTSTSTGTMSTITIISGTTVFLTTTTSASTMSGTTPGSSTTSTVLSSVPYTSGTSSQTSSTTSASGSISSSVSIIVVASTTITFTNSGEDGPGSTSGPGTSSTRSTLTVITATPVTSTTSITYITTTVPNIIEGCGTASGSGVVEGTGTVLIDDTSIVASGTASGSASQVVGCGTVIATTGTFTGSATITGCGSGSGTGTLTGTGTIWPPLGGGIVSIVSSGIVSGSGRFEGCGTLTGSGTFVATGPYNTTIAAPITTASSSGTRAVTTVEVYVSYCPGPMDNALLRLGTNFTGYTAADGNGNGNGSNMTSPALSPDNDDVNSRFIVPTTHSSSNSTSNNSTSLGIDNALCNTCPNSVGICCPPTVDCDGADGKCPLYALENSHNTLNGYLIAQVLNSSAPVAGRKKVRALPKPKRNIDKEMAVAEYDMAHNEAREVGGAMKKRDKKHQLPKKAHRRQF